MLFSFDLFYPTNWKCSRCILDHMQSTFLCLGRFLKELANDQCSSITKGSYLLYKIYTVSLHRTLYSMEMDWPENWQRNSSMVYIWTYCVFTLCGNMFISGMFINYSTFPTILYHVQGTIDLWNANFKVKRVLFIIIQFGCPK